jgi:hypothetical protein
MNSQAMPNALAWLLSAIGVAGLLFTIPLAIVFPIVLLLGGASAGTALLIVTLAVGVDAASKYDSAIYVVPAIFSGLFAVIGTIRGVANLYRSGQLPSILTVAAEAFKHLLTLHLAFQVCAGSVSAVVGVLATEGVSKMPFLVVALFSVFVFIVSATFTSYFMRSLIPWRKEHPRFSDAVAYTLSTILGLIAAAYAFAGTETFKDASNIGALLYQASVAVGTIGATIVGAYVAILERRRNQTAE